MDLVDSEKRRNMSCNGHLIYNRRGDVDVHMRKALTTIVNTEACVSMKYIVMLGIFVTREK
jgi:hypothetical protein